MIRRPPRSTLFPHPPLFRSVGRDGRGSAPGPGRARTSPPTAADPRPADAATPPAATCSCRSEEHTSELQSRLHLVCRLLLEKKKTDTSATPIYRYSLHSDEE